MALGLATNPGPGIVSESISSTSSSYLISYASPVGSSNNVAPPGFLQTASLRMNVTLALGAATWTGLTPGIDNQSLIILNTDPTNTLTLTYVSGSSTTGWQFYGPGSSLAMAPGFAQRFVYYTSLGYWVPIA